MDIFDILIKGMPRNPSDNCDFWTDGEEIMCREKEQAEALALMLLKLLPGSTPTVTLLKEINWYCVNI